MLYIIQLPRKYIRRISTIRAKILCFSGDCIRDCHAIAIINITLHMVYTCNNVILIKSFYKDVSFVAQLIGFIMIDVY